MVADWVKRVKKMQKIVYITALGHSGSTVLDMSLGCHPKMVGLGEVQNVIEAGYNRLSSHDFSRISCSCGEDMYHCDFWSGVKNWLLSNSNEKDHEKYRFLLRYFSEKYGDEAVLVDSSKGQTSYLTFLHERYDLYVLFLIRDYRSWIYSRYSRHKRNIFKLAAQWLSRNVKIKRYLTRKKIRFIMVGYEELAIYPEIILEKICNFLGVSFAKEMLVPNMTNSHIIRGNVARGDREKTQRFFYDARWLTSTKLNLYGPLMFPLMKWNRENVYQNILIGQTHAFGVSQNDFVLFGDKRKEDLVFKLGEFEEQYSKDKHFRKSVRQSSQDNEET
jgi:hypothetical protein